MVEVLIVVGEVDAEHLARSPVAFQDALDAPNVQERIRAAETIGKSGDRAAYETLRSRGAEFLTPPVEYDWEVRAFFRDPDGHLLEISQAK